MKEVQVKTGGYEAEYGQATGGVVNVVTKSGIQHAARHRVRLHHDRDALEADFDARRHANGTVHTTATQLSRSGYRGGGPVLRNRLFFFGAIDPRGRRTTPRRAGELSRSPAWATVDRDRQITSYAAKATWQAGAESPHRRFVLRRSVARATTGRSARRRCSRTTRRGSARWISTAATIRPSATTASLASNWLVEASFSRALNRIYRNSIG